ncbi:hypothetical protein JHK85_001045 [Glycine max]|nr:hypothetical protein JHK85_001045 [Glycine max]
MNNNDLVIGFDEGDLVVADITPRRRVVSTRCLLHRVEAPASGSTARCSRSSLAAARADNFYYPPEWEPSQGSLNKFHGQHALRERARKLDQGILIIRFEMPFNIWCGGCNSMIAKGVRFNAEKKQVGNYYSTKIWSFAMKSACCKHEIVIQTNPKNCEYVIISGAQKKTEDFDIEDAETFELPADEERGKLADPFYRLEHQEEDLKKKKEAEPVIVRLQRQSDARHSDDYYLNKTLRAQLRSQKKRVTEEENASKKRGLGIRLLPATEQDSATAKSVKFSAKFDKNRKDKRALISSESIFSGVSSYSMSDKRKRELESKRRKICATSASSLLAGRVKPSSWSQPSSKQKGTHYAMAGLNTCLVIHNQDTTAHYLLNCKIGISHVTCGKNLSAVRLETTKMLLEPLKLLKQVDAQLNMTQGTLGGMGTLYLKYLHTLAERTELGRLTAPSLLRLVDEAVLRSGSRSYFNGKMSSEIWDALDQMLERGSSAFSNPQKFGCFLVMDPNNPTSINSALRYWGCTIQAGAQVSGAFGITSQQENLESFERAKKEFSPLPSAFVSRLSMNNPIDWSILLQDTSNEDARHLLNSVSSQGGDMPSAVRFDIKRKSATLFMPGFD